MNYIRRADYYTIDGYTKNFPKEYPLGEASVRRITRLIYSTTQ